MKRLVTVLIVLVVAAGVLGAWLWLRSATPQAIGRALAAHSGRSVDEFVVDELKISGDVAYFHVTPRTGVELDPAFGYARRTWYGWTVLTFGTGGGELSSFYALHNIPKELRAEPLPVLQTQGGSQLAATSSDVLTYKADAQLFTVRKTTVAVRDVLDPAYWGEHVKSLMEQYYQDTDTGVRYDFNYLGESQTTTPFSVTVIPNKIGYEDSQQFAAAFQIESAGGSLYPHNVTAEYLSFVNSCGSGFSDDSGKPIGCDVVREQVEPTLRLE